MEAPLAFIGIMSALTGVIITLMRVVFAWDAAKRRKVKANTRDHRPPVMRLAEEAGIDYALLSKDRDWLEGHLKLTAPDVESDLDKAMKKVEEVVDGIYTTIGPPEQGAEEVQGQGVRVRRDVHPNRTKADEAYTKLHRAGIPVKWEDFCQCWWEHDNWGNIQEHRGSCPIH